jgi:hypothetical protein
MIDRPCDDRGSGLIPAAGDGTICWNLSFVAAAAVVIDMMCFFLKFVDIIRCRRCCCPSLKKRRDTLLSITSYRVAEISL